MCFRLISSAACPKKVNDEYRDAEMLERSTAREGEGERDNREERGLSRDTKTCPNFPRDHYTVSQPHPNPILLSYSSPGGREGGGRREGGGGEEGVHPFA